MHDNCGRNAPFILKIRNVYTFNTEKSKINKKQKEKQKPKIGPPTGDRVF